MIPAEAPRRADGGREEDRRSHQHTQARIRGQVPAPPARPAAYMPPPEPVALPETTPVAEGGAA